MPIPEFSNFSFTGKGIYKEDMKASYNWPDDVPFRSLNNGKDGDAPRATKDDFIKIFTYFMKKYEQVSSVFSQIIL